MLRGACTPITGYFSSLRSLVTIICLWLAAQTFFFGRVGPDLGFISKLRPDRVLFAVMLVMVARLALRRELILRRLRGHELLMPTLTLLFTISLFASGAIHDHSEGKNKYLSVMLNITVFPFVAYFICRALPCRKEAIMSVLRFLYLMGIYLSLTGIFEHFELNSLIWPGYIVDPSMGIQFGRARGPFLESVAMGRVLTMSFAAFLVMSTVVHGFKAFLAYSLCLLSSISIYFTYTRGPWLGAAVVVIAFLYYASPVRRAVRVGSMLLLIIAASGLAGKLSLWHGTLFSQRQDTVEDRAVSYLTTLKMIQAHPLLGIGYGRFNAEWDNYYKGFSTLEFTGFDGSHNTWLTMAAELGLPTLLLFLSMLYCHFRTCVDAYRRLDESSRIEKSFVVMVIGLAGMYVLTGTFSDLRWNQVQNCLMFVLFGLIASMREAIQTVSSCQTECTEGSVLAPAHAL